MYFSLFSIAPEKYKYRQKWKHNSFLQNLSVIVKSKVKIYNNSILQNLSVIVKSKVKLYNNIINNTCKS